MSARTVIEQLVTEIAHGPVASAFKPGDVLVPVDGSYPDDAVTVYEVTADGVAVHPLGGGFGGKLKQLDGWRVVPDTEQKPSELRPAVFYLDTVDGKVPGFYDGNYWNGWAQPYFTREAGLQLVAMMRAVFDGAYYDKATDSFMFDGEGDVEEYAGMDVEGKHLYPIGAGVWMWSVEDDD